MVCELHLQKITKPQGPLKVAIPNVDVSIEKVSSSDLWRTNSLMVFNFFASNKIEGFFNSSIQK